VILNLIQRFRPIPHRNYVSSFDFLGGSHVLPEGLDRYLIEIMFRLSVGSYYLSKGLGRYLIVIMVRLSIYVWASHLLFKGLGRYLVEACSRNHFTLWGSYLLSKGLGRYSSEACGKSRGSSFKILCFIFQNTFENLYSFWGLGWYFSEACGKHRGSPFKNLFRNLSPFQRFRAILQLIFMVQLRLPRAPRGCQNLPEVPRGWLAGWVAGWLAGWLKSAKNY